MTQAIHSSRNDLNTLRGTGALAVAAVQGITDVVEELHGAIVNLALPLQSKLSLAKRKASQGWSIAACAVSQRWWAGA
jgi:hypothetical protein